MTQFGAHVERTDADSVEVGETWGGSAGGGPGVGGDSNSLGDSGNNEGDNGGLEASPDTVLVTSARGDAEDGTTDSVTNNLGSTESVVKERVGAKIEVREGEKTRRDWTTPFSLKKQELMEIINMMEK